MLTGKNTLEVMGTRVNVQTNRQTDIYLKKNKGQKWENSQQASSIRKKPKCKRAEVTRESFVEVPTRLEDAFGVGPD